jgi:hypothetical protein
VQTATAQSTTGIFRGYGVAPPGFQAGWSDCIYFFIFSFFDHFIRSSGTSV